MKQYIEMVIVDDFFSIRDSGTIKVYPLSDKDKILELYKDKNVHIVNKG